MNIAIENIQLLGTRILIKPDPVATLEVVTNGLVTATGRKIESREGVNDSMSQLEPPTGVIVAVGPDVTTLSPGDRVIFSPFSGKKLTFMMDDYLMMSEPEPVMKVVK